MDDYLCDYPKTLLVVSHDADFLDSVCTDVVHLEERKLVQYKGGYSEFRKGHAARVREREKEVKKQQEEKKAGKKVHQEEAGRPRLVGGVCRRRGDWWGVAWVARVSGRVMSCHGMSCRV